MEYLPEQEKVLEHLRRRGTDAEPQALLAEAREAFAEFRDAFTSVPAPLRLMEPFPGKWSPQEIMDHVVECHRIAPGQLQRMLHGEPGDTPIRAFVQSAAPLAKHWRALLKEFNTVHDEIIAAAEQLSQAPMPEVTAPIEIVVRIDDVPRTRELEWTEQLDWKAYLQALRSHALQHIKQLDRTLQEIEEA